MMRAKNIYILYYLRKIEKNCVPVGNVSIRFCDILLVYLYCFIYTSISYSYELKCTFPAEIKKKNIVFPHLAIWMVITNNILIKNTGL